jgi:ketosteroid isomerase-like protein
MAEQKTDEQRIGELIERWAVAAHTGDLDTVLVDHTDDIVMFDVPPPQDGAAARRLTAPPGRGSSSGRQAVRRSTSWSSTSRRALTSHSRGRCCAAAPQRTTAHPERRLRITFGLRKEDGRWQVAHEHHSFPDETPAPATTAHPVAARPPS